jgi:hypothetical protein
VSLHEPGGGDGARRPAGEEGPRRADAEDRRSALLRETEKGLGDTLGHLLPYIEEVRRIEEDLTEEERVVISRFLKAATEATHRHAERLSELDA